MQSVEHETATLNGAIVVHASGTTVFGPIGRAVPATARMGVRSDTVAMPPRARNAEAAMQSAEDRSVARRPALRLAFGQGDR